MSWPLRGEVYWLNFDPSTGSEMQSLHPAVIVQNDIGNQHSALTMVAAVTSNLRASNLPIGVLVSAGTAGLTKECVIHCGHIYTVDKKRLGHRIGTLPDTIVGQVNDALLRSFGL